MNKSENIGELAAALSKAQGEIVGAIKDSSNPFFKSSYADLASVWDACREQLTKNGLSIVQMPVYDPSGGIGMETVLMHSSGEWLSAEFGMTPVKADPQGIGSCITYMRRYALAAFAGVPQIDDDANNASGKVEKKVASVPPNPLTAPTKARLDTAKYYDEFLVEWKTLTMPERDSVRDLVDWYKEKLTSGNVE